MQEATQREAMEFDVVVVGAGPAGLAAACRLAQLAAERGTEYSIVVVEKGSEVGAHILSGNVFEPRGLDELFPDWRSSGAPAGTPVEQDRVLWLRSADKAVTVPAAFVPRSLHNDGNYIISLGRLCQWLAERAEGLGVNVFPGFAASEVLYDDEGRVRGVATADVGIDRNGERKSSYQPGYELLGRYTVFAEGCRGNLGEALMKRFDLRAGRDPQHYGIGLKEVWEIDADRHEEGTVVHTAGWPLDTRTDGGGFLYHAAQRKVYLGLIVALNYRNPHLSPFDEFQRWKLHPEVRGVIEGGERIAYGARAVNKGGLQSLPRLSFPGGLLVGCDAGFLNNARIKGAHTAIKSGTLAAESIDAAFAAGDEGYGTLEDLDERFRSSWLHEELHRARNFGPGIKKFGTLGGAAFAFVDQSLFRGRMPFTWRNPVPDHECIDEASQAEVIDYPKPDGKLTFDRLSSVFLSSTNHEEDQPSHLKLIDESIPIDYNLPKYDEPAQRYCPAAVYEVVEEKGEKRFRINAQNCVHCKTCDIKDPTQNIVWTVPEGGGGPNYPAM